MFIDGCCGRLHVECKGEGRAILLWHSLLCDGNMWEYQIGPLSQRYFVVNIDAPGHGRSDPMVKPYSMDDCVEALFEVMDALSINEAAMVGLSWGGMVGMRAAIARPDRIKALAVLDSNADAESWDRLPKYRLMGWIADIFGPIPPLLDRLEPIFFSDLTRKQRPDLIRKLREGIIKMDRASIRHAVHCVEFDRKDIRSQLCRIVCPTLVMCGTEDRATPIERSKDIACRIPGAELALIPGAGHLSAWECPELVNPILLSWLERVWGGEAPGQEENREGA
ncbi:MAG: alpha/beta hydrolase [Sandaracinaceae bacterium]|nr:alpha/beta hydrolase [Sandaracinaceae bacterium]